MNEMISLSINIHLFLIAVTIFAALYAIYSTKSVDNPVQFVNRMKFFQPQYLVILTALGFTGITVMAVNMFVIKLNLIVMIIALVALYATSIKKHAARKAVNTNDAESVQYFRKYVSKKYMIDIAVLVAASILSFALA